MPTALNDVYRKFGEAPEAAQLLETELGTILLFHRAVIQQAINITDSGIETDPSIAMAVLEKVNKQTFGQILKATGFKARNLGQIEVQLLAALSARNRLLHSYYREQYA